MGQTWEMLVSLVERYDLIYQTGLFFRIVVAGFLGCLIGYERKNHYKSAGMRTHAIVAMGAALMMVVSKYGFRDVPNFDASRIASQIVSGIGFLGAGVIFVKNHSVSGLTTAAGIWATAGVGMAIGAGAYYMGCGAGFFLIFTQIILHDVPFLSREPYRSVLKITTSQYDSLIEELISDLNEEKIKVLNMKVGKAKDCAKVELDLLYPAGYGKNDLIIKWSNDKRIESISG
ncbi:MgtC/SapB family protein [Lacrimispora indolis]|uniref:MgtC/SapB family protein n=1 Tax=Lacrimispora indolis TaxID=69825 RepID=UPI0004B679C7|nr:MgtC/SapB family protein [Lacrimispora indolis]